MQKRYRLAVVAYHPIQYQAPLFRRLAADPDIDLEVLYCSAAEAEEYWDAGFSRLVKWDRPLSEGFVASVMPNRGRHDRRGFFGLFNPGVVTALRRGGFHAVMVHGWRRATDWIAMVSGVASGVPVLLRAEGTSLSRTARWKLPVKRPLLRSLFSRVSGFLSTGRYCTDFYRAHGVPDERLFTMPYAVDNDFFCAEAARLSSGQKELRRELGISQDSVVILFSGKLIPRKRPLDLLKAFQRLPSNTAASLVFMGDGELRSALESAVEAASLTDVHLVGFQNQTEISRFYALADVFALPAAFETWGLVVNEAMCFGLPIVASDRVGATGDLVRQDVNGFIYPVGDVEALSMFLRALIEDSAMRQHMGRASQDLIAEWSFEEDLAALKACLAVTVGPRRSE